MGTLSLKIRWFSRSCLWMCRTCNALRDLISWSKYILTKTEKRWEKEMMSTSTTSTTKSTLAPNGYCNGFSTFLKFVSVCCAIQVYICLKRPLTSSYIIAISPSLYESDVVESILMLKLNIAIAYQLIWISRCSSFALFFSYTSSAFHLLCILFFFRSCLRIHALSPLSSAAPSNIINKVN